MRITAKSAEMGVAFREGGPNPQAIQGKIIWWSMFASGLGPVGPNLEGPNSLGHRPRRALPDFIPWGTGYESLNYGISNY